MISSRITMTTDEAAIQAILQQFETAWNAYDSVSIAVLFVEDANFIHIFGGSWTGEPPSRRRIGSSLTRSTGAAAPGSSYGAFALCAPTSRSSSPERR